MRLADPNDPAVQAEIREENWDKKCEAFPRCHECGESLYPHDTYTELGDHLYCAECVRNQTYPIDRLEVF